MLLLLALACSPVPADSPANAFFAAAEFALVSVRETRIQQLIEL